MFRDLFGSNLFGNIRLGIKMAQLEQEPSQIREIEVTGTSIEKPLEKLEHCEESLKELLENPNFPQLDIQEDIPERLQNLPYSLNGMNNAQLEELLESVQRIADKTPNLGLSHWAEEILPSLQSIYAASRPSNAIEIFKGEDKKPHLRILENLKQKE